MPMRRYLYAVVAGSSLSVILSAQAQVTPTATAAAPRSAAVGDETTPGISGEAVEEIIVNARRKEELIQDVPQSIDAVSGKSLEELDLLNFQDLGNVVAGLTLQTGTITTLRGVTFSPVSGASPTVSLYVNDAPVQSAFLFNSTFDVGQFEVLRGPQGTYRGQSAPTGAINLTTRTPDLYEFGGSGSVTVTNLSERNFQGALNMPLIEDKLALRIAGLADHNDNGGITSVNSTAQPASDTNAFRATLRAEPTDSLSAILMFQNLRSTLSSFSASATYGGPATGGPVLGTPNGYAQPFVQPPGYNGQSIAMGQLLSAAHDIGYSSTRQQIATAEVGYRLFGQKLSYNGGYSKIFPGPNVSWGDADNMLNGGNYPGVTINTNLKRLTNELRLSAEERIAGIFDYVVGIYHQKEDITNSVNMLSSFEPGAFGSPAGAPIPGNPNLAYAIFSPENVPSHTTETSEFANVTAHLWWETELSAGIRLIRANSNSVRTNGTTAALKAQNCALGGVPSTNYPGLCDVTIPGGVNSAFVSNYTRKPSVYNFSLSHHFTPDIMAYFSTGSSWRAGPVQSAFPDVGSEDPVINSFNYLPDEKSKSYELGLKTSWLDRRLQTDIAVFHQTYQNFVTGGATLGLIPYRTDNPGILPVNLKYGPYFFFNVPAKVDGIDFSTSYVITKNWNVRAAFSYADGKISNATTPCYDPTFTGTAAQFNPSNFAALFAYVAQLAAHNEHVALCSGYNGSTATTATWTGNVESEYSHPITSSVDGYVSGLVTYTPRNPYSSQTYTVPSNALVNLYVGFRNPATGWEIQVFAKNLFKREFVSALQSTAPVANSQIGGYFGSPGYIDGISYGPRQEFGLTVRYAVGSR
jgi:iron complex outermembrane receptor protein